MTHLDSIEYTEMDNNNNALCILFFTIRAIRETIHLKVCYLVVLINLMHLVWEKITEKVNSINPTAVRVIKDAQKRFNNMVQESKKEIWK